MDKRKTGTREWSDFSYNIGVGCAHDCLYCYARTNAERIKAVSEGGWTKERIKTKLPAISKKDGWIMFPTTHDITPFYLPTALTCLVNLLVNGNKVLIVSKPHMECVKQMCDVLETWKSNVLFRFTIGTPYNHVAEFWEPGAPSITERLECLQYAFDKGYATSISMEPMLGTVEETLCAVLTWSNLVTDKIWIGKMNKIANRVKKSSVDVSDACDLIEESQSDKNIMWLVRKLKNHPKVEWKDSIKEVIERNK